MSEFRLTQISDTHLARRLQRLTDNFHRVSEHIDATRPDLVDQQRRCLLRRADQPQRSRICQGIARRAAGALPHLPGNHDVGDNPTAVGPAPKQPATEKERQNYLSVIGEDRWRFEAAGWCFIGLNSLIMNTGIESEAEQFDWLASELARVNGKPVALFLHKPLYLHTPEDPETEATRDPLRAAAPAQRLDRDVFARSICGWSPAGHVHQRRDFTFGHTRHVWAPSAGFIIPDRMQEVIGIKEVGLVEYRFRPDSFEVRHVRAPGQTDVDLEELLGKK